VEHLEVAHRDARGDDLEMTRAAEPSAPSAAQAARENESPAALSWTAFGERYFPERRRHDFEVLSAFVNYLAAAR
jgi:hypothetical protein